MGKNNMSTLSKPVLRAASILGFFSFIGIGLVSLTHLVTEDRIIENERLFVTKTLREIVPDKLHDNDLLNSSIQVVDPLLAQGNRPVTLYKAFKNNNLVAIIASPMSADGYNGTIKLLVAIKKDGSLLGVRVTSHHETPGLGDGIESHKSDWIHSFNGLSLQQPPLNGWAVKRDGGQFDQFTGATITPRAVVKAVLNTLKYYQANRALLMDANNE